MRRSLGSRKHNDSGMRLGGVVMPLLARRETRVNALR
jgi:hypothetical protein